ncbi:N-acetyltransferase [Candidatus Parcubacteria bacterium]|jgi:ribosomal protein S18 acetylase RimI-like enzyme|nr:MAG: N-acetyltransferase [Candidatus Parcubacteria bacterium]
MTKQAKLKIRKAKLSDCPAVHRLAKTPGLTNPGGKAPNINWLKLLTKNRGIFLVASLNHKIVGFILGEKLIGIAVMVWLMAVEKNLRGQGIGRALVKAFEKTCLQQGRNLFVAYAYAKNPVIIKMLKKYGFNQGNLFYEFLKLPKAWK